VLQRLGFRSRGPNEQTEKGVARRHSKRTIAKRKSASGRCGRGHLLQGGIHTNVITHRGRGENLD